MELYETLGVLLFLPILIIFYGTFLHPQEHRHGRHLKEHENTDEGESQEREKEDNNAADPLSRSGNYDEKEVEKAAGEGTGCNQAVHVVIIGGGLAGLALAIALSQRQLKCMIIERRSFTPAGSSLTVQRNGLKALWELKPDIVSHMLMEGLLVEATGAIMLPWGRMRDMLLYEVLFNTNTEVYSRSTLTFIDKTEEQGSGGGRLKVHVCDTDDEGNLAAPLRRWVVDASMVIGADGYHSSVRKIYGLSDSVSSGAHVVRGWVDLSGNQQIAEELIRYTQERNKISPVTIRKCKGFFIVFNYFRIHFGHVCWVCTAKLDDNNIGDIKNHVLDKIFTKPRDDLRGMARLGWNIVLMTHSSDIIASKIETIDLPSDDNAGWGGSGRMTLIGDAAHAMRAASGQGAATTFEDVVALARGIDTLNSVSEIHNYESCNKILREFERFRLPRVRLISENERLLAEASYHLLPRMHDSDVMLDVLTPTLSSDQFIYPANPDIIPRGLCMERLSPSDTFDPSFLISKSDPHKEMSPLMCPDFLRGYATDDQSHSPVSYEGEDLMKTAFRAWLYEGI